MNDFIPDYIPVVSIKSGDRIKFTGLGFDHPCLEIDKVYEIFNEAEKLYINCLCVDKHFLDENYSIGMDALEGFVKPYQLTDVEKEAIKALIGEWTATIIGKRLLLSEDILFNKLIGIIERGEYGEIKK